MDLARYSKNLSSSTFNSTERLWFVYILFKWFFSFIELNPSVIIFTPAISIWIGYLICVLLILKQERENFVSVHFLNFFNLMIFIYYFCIAWIQPRLKLTCGSAFRINERVLFLRILTWRDLELSVFNYVKLLDSY